MQKRDKSADADYKRLLENLEGVSDLPPGRGDNIQVTDEDEEILRKLYERESEKNERK